VASKRKKPSKRPVSEKAKKPISPKIKKTPKSRPLSAKALFKKRSAAAKKSWITRRQIVSAEPDDLIKKLRDENEELKRQLIQTMIRFEKVITIDGLPPRFYQETAERHAVRLIALIKKQGIYSIDEAYRAIAQESGLHPREVYRLFHYVGTGEFVA